MRNKKFVFGGRLVIADSIKLSKSPPTRRPVVGYLIKSMMASNRLCNTSISTALMNSDDEAAVLQETINTSR